MKLGDYNIATAIIIVLSITFFLIVVTVEVVQWFLFFKAELKYLNCEIKRTEGKEQRYWKKKKRQLWMSILPFVKYRKF